MSERWTYDTSISTIRNEEGRRIADVYWSPETYMRAVQRGRVMAAGHDLIEAVETLLVALKNSENLHGPNCAWCQPEYDRAVEVAELALAKARGEA